jgi:hypothetical protein
VSGNADLCGPCETEALLRVIAVADCLEAVLWADVDPVRGVDAAVIGLRRARAEFVAAGYGRGT